MVSVADPGGSAVAGLLRRWQRAGVRARILAALQASAGAAGQIVWDVSVDFTTARAQQHAAGARNRGDCRQNRTAGSETNRPTVHSAGPVAA